MAKNERDGAAIGRVVSARRENEDDSRALMMRFIYLVKEDTE